MLMSSSPDTLLIYNTVTASCEMDYKGNDEYLLEV